MFSSNYKVTIAIIAVYLTLNIAHAMENKSNAGTSLYEPSNPQVKQCLDGIVTVFEYKFKNEEEKNYRELTVNMCLEIAIRKFTPADIDAKYEKEPNLNESTEMGLTYYRWLKRMWNTSAVKRPIDFCKDPANVKKLEDLLNELAIVEKPGDVFDEHANVGKPEDVFDEHACLDELFPIFGEKSSYSSAMILFDSSINDPQIYTNLYIKYLAKNIEFYGMDDRPEETMEPVGFCEHICSPQNDFFGDDDD